MNVVPPKQDFLAAAGISQHGYNAAPAVLQMEQVSSLQWGQLAFNFDDMANMQTQRVNAHHWDDNLFRRLALGPGIIWAKKYWRSAARGKLISRLSSLQRA